MRERTERDSITALSPRQPLGIGSITAPIILVLAFPSIESGPSSSPCPQLQRLAPPVCRLILVRSNLDPARSLLFSRPYCQLRSWPTFLRSVQRPLYHPGSYHRTRSKPLGNNVKQTGKQLTRDWDRNHPSQTTIQASLMMVAACGKS